MRFSVALCSVLEPCVGKAGTCCTDQLFKFMQCCRSVPENSVLLYAPQEVIAGKEIWCIWRPIQPVPIRIQKVLRETHDNTTERHYGVMKPLRKTRERFYWDRRRKMVQRVPNMRSPKRTQKRTGKVSDWTVSSGDAFWSNAVNAL
ncbi:hypothetical protein AVEN_127731-1 [Araneus ventricosus]|uniref:Integrase zinc-binding domain-containing protein n=1 Tax=Araneus ventricosus TaxID=182803 RepID=A0A4Y2PCC8_ARAVE|nr:hypothetical protein AVEN_127731-1 [Araneus ventricosus]